MTDLVLLLLFLLSTGAIAGLSAGLFGVGGGFIVVPALVYGFASYGMMEREALLLAVGTSLGNIVLTSASSLYAHNKKEAVDFSILRSWSVPLALGACVGVIVANYLSPNELKLVFAIFVSTISIKFLYPQFLLTDRQYPQMLRGMAKYFFGLSLGSLSAMLGIGGGSLAVILLTIAGRPLHKAIGTASGFGFCIALPSALGFILIGFRSEDLLEGSLGYIHFPSLILISLVSIWLAPKAAKFAHSLSEQVLSRIFGVYLLCIATLMFTKI